jgi:hypothetical protein
MLSLFTLFVVSKQLGFGKPEEGPGDRGKESLGPPALHQARGVA